MSASQSQMFESPVVHVKGSILDSLEMAFLGVAQKLILDCANMYNFDADEACRRLNISSLKIVDKAPSAPKVKAPKVKSSQIPLPFTGKKEGVCLGLKRNYGLFTQCVEIKVNESGFCKSCAKEHEKTGTVDDRLNGDMFNYVSKDGKKSVPFVNIMKKMNLTKEQVLEEAEKQGVEIPEGHFAEKAKKEKKEKNEKKETEKKGKGRPKKEKKVLNTENEVSDLFSELIQQANESDDDEAEKPKENESLDKEEAKKEALRLKEEAKKEALRLKEEAKKEALRLKEEAKEAEKLAKEAQKKELARLKEEAKEAQKKELARLKEEAKKALEVFKSPKKEKAQEEKTEKPAAKSPAKAKILVEEPEEVEVKVKKFEYNGVKYLRDFNTNKIYDRASQEEIGIFNEKTKKIEFNKLAVESEEESEDEYDD